MAPAAAAAGAPISLQFCGFSVEGPSLSNPHHGGVAILCWGLNRKRGGLTAGPSPHGAAGRSGPPIWPAWLGAPGGVGDCALSSFLLEEETQNFNKGSPKETALGGVTEQEAGGPPRCPGTQPNGLRPWGMENWEERREAWGWMPRTGPRTSSHLGHCWQESCRGPTRPIPRHRASVAQRLPLRGGLPVQARLRAAPQPQPPPHP